VDAHILDKLINADAILIVGSGVDYRDLSYTNEWEWGITSGMFHFSIKNGRYITIEEAIARQEQRALVDPSPPLWSDNSEFSDIEQLPWPEFTGGPLKLMRDRRTHRDLLVRSIEARQLSDCLFSGLGITGVGLSPSTGDVPFTMTPSGGARNPFDAYVYVLSVQGVARGAYLHSGATHTLGLISKQLTFTPGQLLGNQDWADNAAAVIF
jgi:hypothetical protein